MNFIDKLKEEYGEDVEVEEVEEGELPFLHLDVEDYCKKISHIQVQKFLAMNWELKQSGIDDKDERYRIIEIIF